jgi:magnesium chelatase family protein
LSDPERACARAPRCAREYQSRISGPLYDRIDLHVDLPELSAADLSLPPPAEGSAEIPARVARARAIQRARYQPLNDEVRTNAKAEGKLLDQVAMPDASGTALLTEAVDKMKLSARGYHRVMRVARTLADFEGADRVGRLLIAEALSYRRISNRVG